MWSRSSVGVLAYAKSVATRKENEIRKMCRDFERELKENHQDRNQRRTLNEDERLASSQDHEHR